MGQPQKKTYELEQRKEKLEELYEKKVQEEIAVQNEIEANTKVVLAAKCLEVVYNEQKEHEQEDKEEDRKEAFSLQVGERYSSDNEECTEDGDKASNYSEDEDVDLKAELDLDIKVEVKCEVDENYTNEEVDVKQEKTVKGEELQTPK